MSYRFYFCKTFSIFPPPSILLLLYPIGPVPFLKQSSRSPAIVVAFLMKSKGWRLPQSYQWVKERRPSVDISQGQTSTASSSVKLKSPNRKRQTGGDPVSTQESVTN
ncbi:hypothetical protein PVK06_012207 [Gossypium arboreum]|uniref:Uncharacterized protein n=1 Tax=Gossypium arboreum TaxID=29729 RepID=A0ABR0QBM0_GOSAR|nr:hypothetical protein PVK06_012207 [Gossypium arboreum]